MKVLQPSRSWLDSLGIGLSSLCVVHCVLLTALIVTSPAIWLRQHIYGVPLRWFAWAEWALAAGAVTLALASAVAGWRGHRRAGPLRLLAAGVTVLLGGIFGSLRAVPLAGTALVVIGGALLVAGHVWNLNLRHVGAGAGRCRGDV